MNKTHLGIAVCCIVSTAQAAPQRSGTPDPWLASLPTTPIVVGDLQPEWGSLSRQAESAGTNGAGATTAGGATQGTRGNGSSAGEPRPADILSPAASSFSDAEPNNTFGTAQATAASSTVSAAIDPARDYDQFHFEVPRRGIIEVRFTQVAGSLDLTFKVHNQDNRDITGWRRTKVTGSETATEIVDLPTAGGYYLIVADHTGKAQGGYTVNWNYHSGDTFEPNDTFGTATTVGPNEAVAISTLPLGDVDWFYFEVENRGIATVYFENVPEDLDLAFKIHNADNRDRTGWRKTKIKNNATVPEIVDLQTAGGYYLIVSDGSSDARAVKPYTLRLSTALSDTAEPNDSVGVATPIAATGRQPLSMLPLKDTDWFVFEVDNQGLLEITFEGVPQNLDISFKVHNAENRDRTGWRKTKMTGSATAMEIVDLAAPGRYFLIVADGDHDSRHVDTFFVNTRFVPGDTHEPNGAVGSAAPIALGSGVQGNILPLGDYDWYVVDVPHPGTLNIHLSNVHPDMDPAFKVHNAENRDRTGWRTPRINNGATVVKAVEITEAGRYFVIVADNKSDARAPTMYTLHVNQ